MAFPRQTEVYSCNSDRIGKQNEVSPINLDGDENNWTTRDWTQFLQQK